MSRTAPLLRPCGESARGGRRIKGVTKLKYMIMTFGSAEAGLAAMGKEWMVDMIQFMRTLDDDLRKSGELVSAEGLARRLLDSGRRQRGTRCRDRLANRRLRQGAHRSAPCDGRAA